MGNYNAYAKYVSIWDFWCPQNEDGNVFKNGHWYSLTGIPVTEGNTVPTQGTDNNINPPSADQSKLYECGGNHLFSDCPLLKQANYIRNSGHVLDGKGGHVRVRVNGDRGGI